MSAISAHELLAAARTGGRLVAERPELAELAELA